MKGARLVSSSWNALHWIATGTTRTAQEKYTNAFMAAGSEKMHFALELTYNYGVSSYDLGAGFGHFALATPDVTAVAESVRKEPLGAPVLASVVVLALSSVLQLQLRQLGPMPGHACKAEAPSIALGRAQCQASPLQQFSDSASAGHEGCAVQQT